MTTLATPRESAMRELTTIESARRWVSEQRAAGRSVGLVPTMGFLHEGHLVLADAARVLGAAVVMSIFVNPLQFGAGEDLANYPRDLPRDRTLAESRGVEALFVPSVELMYPATAEIRVVPGPSAERWEGAARPGHFAGVLTVVSKLFHIVQPDFACFGRKDIQQVTLVRQMVRDLDWPVELVVVPTVREPDGLALSSRNVYLSPGERSKAVALSEALQVAHEAWKEGERRTSALLERMWRSLAVHPEVQVEYTAVTEPTRLEPVELASGDSIVAIAARLGRARLIDNVILGEGVT